MEIVLRPINTRHRRDRVVVVNWP